MVQPRPGKHLVGCYGFSTFPMGHSTPAYGICTIKRVLTAERGFEFPHIAKSQGDRLDCLHEKIKNINISLIFFLQMVKTVTHQFQIALSTETHFHDFRRGN